MPVASIPSAALAEALALHRQGRLQEAEARYTGVLVKEPGNAAARYHLGLVRLQRGNLEGGIAALKPLLKSVPEHVEAHYNLGRAYSESGRHEQALSCFERAAALRPTLAEVQFYLGLTLAYMGRKEAALPPLQRAISLRPELAEAHHAHASVLNELGRYEPALRSFEKALALRPGFAEAHNGLGTALFGLNRLQEAAVQYREAIRLKPDYAEAYTGLSDVLRSLGDFQAAVECGEQAIRVRPGDAVAHVVLGQALTEQGKYQAALAALEQALVMQPDCAAAHGELGAMLHLWGRHAEARLHGDKALALAPHDSKAASVQLFYLHYDADISAADLALRHCGFADRFEAPLKAGWRPHANAPDPERALRVGFVSADFRQHPVGYFMADLLGSLKATGLELYAYATHWTADAMTERIQPLFDVWRECSMSDDALADQIRADGIDILVDLGGHTKGNRLLAFVRKPAPVQVSYLGYFDTTGLDAMDYILGNRWLLPEAEEEMYSEKPWHLPDAHLCFTPPDLPVAVGPLPAQAAGHVTFGCFNRIDKVNSRVVANWAQLLHVVPGSRLYLKSRALGDAAVAEHYRVQFAEHGIGAERLILEGESGFGEYLESYQRVDIALDPYPYNGGTTTVQAMWMGAPTLTLRGDRYAAHMGESILHAVDMPEWIARDEEDYVAKAASFARDIAGLSALRANLRDRLLASPICDAPGFARTLEETFRGMWRQWCKRPGNQQPC